MSKADVWPPGTSIVMDPNQTKEEALKEFIRKAEEKMEASERFMEEFLAEAIYRPDSVVRCAGE